jgi:hypothetical protein
MKNKKVIIMLSFLLIGFAYGEAQDVKVFWGKQNPLEKGGLPDILARRGDHLLGTSRNLRGTKVNIVKYSFDGLQIQNEYPVIGKAKDGQSVIDSKYRLEDFTILKNKLYIGVSNYNKKTDLNSYYAQEIGDDGKLTGSLKKLADISSTSRRNSGRFDVFESKDSTKILMVSNPPYEKYANEKFGFKIFDENLKEINNLEVTLPYKDKYFSVSDYVLSKDGNIYALAKIEIPRKEKEKDEAGYYYEIISINPNGKEDPIEYEIKLSQKYITDISFIEEGKNIICAGFYNNIEIKGRSHNDINGIFYLRINKDSKSIEAKGIKDLDKQFIAELTSTRKANKGRGIASTFQLKNFIQKDNGGAILVSENSYDYEVRVCSTDPKTGAQSCHTEYHYVRNNIIVINIEPTGAIKWYCNIPKYQHTVNDQGVYISYMLSTAKDKIYFVYNDNAKNLDPERIKKSDDIRPLGNPYKSVATLVTLSENGTFEKKALFSNKENKVVLLPSYSHTMEDGQLIVPAIHVGIYCCFIPLKKGNYRLARFQFN